MGDPGSAEESVIWFWIIEYLLHFPKVKLDLSYEIMKLAPPFRYDLTKKVRELIALGRLEELCNYGDGTSDGTLELNSTARFDMSETCVDVLDHILHEASVSDFISRRGWQRDIRPFIMHKRSAMAKTSLEQIRDAARDGIIPDASSLHLKEAVPHMSEPDKPTLIVVNERPDEVGNEENVHLVKSSEGNKQHPKPSHLDAGKESSCPSKKSQADEIVQECQLISRHKESPETSCSLRQMKAPRTWEDKKISEKRVKFSSSAGEKGTPSTRVVTSDRTLEDLKEKWRSICKWKPNLE